MPACSIRRRVPTSFSSPARHARAAFLGVRDQLQMTVVALQADETQARRRVDLPSQDQGRLAGRDAAAIHADVHLDEDADGRARFLGGLAHVRDVVRIIDAHAHRGTASERCQPAEFVRPDDLVGDVYVGKARGDEGLGLVELGTQEAVGAGVGDVVGEAGAFERLEVDTGLDAALAAGGKEAMQVRIDDVEIDEEGR